jgi:flagellar biosynthesis protein FlhF|uniref:Flagellar biosynthesis protein FlhF n=1 Tax=Mesoaciditoga lauensis TaxID=1495039 RepID=A0A7V3RF88_9BACT
MELKKYTAPTMAEVMIRIKGELGDDAIIVQTRKVKRGGFLGIGSKAYVEVTAVKEDDKIEDRNKERYQAKSSSLEEELVQIKRDIKSVSDKLSEVNMTGLFPEPFEGIRIHLIELGMKPSEAFAMVNNLNKKMTVEDCENQAKLEFALKESLNGFIKCEKINFVSSQKAIFVGPTGVGKTTTIAKIAAKLSLKEKLPTLLLSLDTYRIAAAQQMKTYADIMHIPFDVIYTPQQANEVISSLGSKVVLIDTAGRSQRDELKISEVETYVKNIKTDFTFLVVDATKKRKDIEDIVLHFSQIGITHVILTKTDETVSLLGPIVALGKLNIPLAFITNGQNVPEDIIYACDFDLQNLLVKEVLEK